MIRKLLATLRKSVSTERATRCTQGYLGSGQSIISGHESWKSVAYTSYSTHACLLKDMEHGWSLLLHKLPDSLCSTCELCGYSCESVVWT
jgi:hypothetical protein